MDNKLIELLNEYEKLNMGRTFIGYYKQEEEITGDYFSIKACELTSKKYGFIKWLVDNDKINFKKFDGDNYNYLENPIGSNNYDTVWDYKTIIQWLSISYTPIEDLISYLK